MKAKAACIGVPEEIVEALSGTEFASKVLARVVGGILEVHDPLGRPAEYYVQRADIGPAPKKGAMGVELRLSGVSRNGRPTECFHQALGELAEIVKETIVPLLYRGQLCQVFCVIMLDGEVEMSPRSGRFSSNLESETQWVEGSR